MPVIGIGTGITFLSRQVSGAGPSLPVPSNNLVVGVGDSITVSSHNTAGAGITTDRQFQPRLLNPSGNTGGFLMWAALLPKTGDTTGNGRFQFNGVHGTGGLTAAQIKTTHIDGTDSPLNDSPKPGIVVVLAGTNDLGTVSPGGVVDNGALDTTCDAIESIWDALIAADILPVACLVPPINTVNNQPAVTAINAQITSRAAAKGIVAADLFTPCATGDNWSANMHSGDGVHPSNLGAKAMGQALRDAIDSALFAGTPNLVTAATDGDADLVFENGAFERDGNADDIPNGGGQGAETNTYWTFTAAGAVPDLIARTGFDGLAWRVNKSTDSGQTTASGTGVGTNDIDLVDGHTYEVGFVFEIASWSGTNTYASLQLNKITDGSKIPFRLNLELDSSFASAIAPFSIISRFRCSDSASGLPVPSGGYRFLFTWGHRTGTPTNNLIDTYMGQLTLRDLGVI